MKIVFSRSLQVYGLITLILTIFSFFSANSEFLPESRLSTLGFISMYFIVSAIKEFQKKKR